MANPFLAFETALPSIINERPSQIMRLRETRSNSFGSFVNYTAGPYIVRIEPMKQAGTQVYDEKGTVASVWFVLLGYNLPRTLEEGGQVVPLFRPEDQITDNEGNVYVVRSPQYCQGKMVQVTIALRG